MEYKTYVGVDVKTVNQFFHYVDEGYSVINYPDSLKKKINARLAIEKDKNDYYLIKYAISIFRTPGNETEFINAAKELISRNNSNGYNLLANAYYYGYGVEKDYQKNIELCKVAINMNNPIAINNMGITYYLGSGVNKSIQKAFYYFRKAATFNYGLAYYRIGRLFYDGIGYPKSNYYAKIYLEKASELNCKLAKDLLKRL